ncbi:MAG: hypothetical protein IT342_10825 [Candidatus Melainabacteria bacterium]|nr:hypothetical protein [Candidatus Melainabacteria bacterium]
MPTRSRYLLTRNLNRTGKKNARFRILITGVRSFFSASGTAKFTSFSLYLVLYTFGASKGFEQLAMVVKAGKNNKPQFTGILRHASTAKFL